jgi:hypothetical protein
MPHLHLQAQEAAVLGAATRPFCLAHYASRAQESDGWIFHTAGLPANAETISPCAFDAALFATLSGWLPGEYRWRVTSEEQGSWEETLIMDFDDTGCFRVRSRRYKAGFRAFLRDQVFFCVDLEGPGQSVAALLALGLGRVPCIVPQAGGVAWSDHVSSVPFAPRGVRWIHDLLDPFTGPSLLSYRYTFGSDGSIQCELQGQGLSMESGVPRSMKVALASRKLATALEVRYTHDRLLRAELMHYQVRPATA